jgi:hypothetical protein
LLNLGFRRTRSRQYFRRCCRIADERGCSVNPLQRMTGSRAASDLPPDVAVGSIASFCTGADHFRFSPVTRRIQSRAASLKGAKNGSPHSPGEGPGLRSIFTGDSRNLQVLAWYGIRSRQCPATSRLRPKWIAPTPANAPRRIVGISWNAP